MPSLISDIEKAEMSAAFNDIHDTFKRPVLIYKTPERVDIITNDNFISAYRNNEQNNGLSYEYTIESGVYDMRIQWLKPSEMVGLPLNIQPNEQICRLKISKDVFDMIKDMQSIYIDDIHCEIPPFYRPHGLFNVDYYTIYAKRREVV